MLELSRCVRFSVNPALPPSPAPSPNTFAGSPPMMGLGAYYEVQVACRGELGEGGFLLNIARIDEAVRTSTVPLIDRAARERAGDDPAALLPDLLAELRGHLPQATSLTWRLTPTYALTVSIHDPCEVLLSQQFEFAAAHRLHCASLSDDDNRRLFGKCNNPAGHGHNYRLEVVVARPEAGERPANGRSLSLPELERIVAERVVERFDHRHLNVDLPEFADVNPSVEHIARVCFERLDGPVGAAGGRLVSTRVWETDKTSCTYAPRES